MSRPGVYVPFAVFLAFSVLAAPVAAERAVARIATAPQSVKVRSVRVDGNLDKARAESALNKALPRFQKCFAKAAKAGTTNTHVDLRLLVRPNGKVVGATVESPRSEPTLDLRRCIQGRAMDVRFPGKGTGHSTVRAGIGDGRPGGLLGMLRSNAPGASGLFKALGKLPAGAGGLGLRGVGRGGGGVGQGTIGLGKVGGIGARRPGPSVRTGNAVVKGSLSKEVIRRVIRRHINQIRYCYERELAAAAPGLEGRVSVRFIIAPTGSVKTANLAHSTLNNSKVEGCVVKAVRRMTFPQPAGGGIVVVTYPFMFKSAP